VDDQGVSNLIVFNLLIKFIKNGNSYTMKTSATIDLLPADSSFDLPQGRSHVFLRKIFIQQNLMSESLVFHLRFLLWTYAISLRMLSLFLRTQTYGLPNRMVLNFVFLSFEFVSYFDIRISDLIW